MVSLSIFTYLSIFCFSAIYANSVGVNAGKFEESSRLLAEEPLKFNSAYSVAKCEFKCLEDAKEVAASPLTCDNYTSTLLNYFLCTDECQYGRVNEVEECTSYLLVQPVFDEFLGLDNTCLACQSISSVLPKLIPEVKCMKKCATFAELRNSFNSSTCSDFVNKVKESKSCYKSCQLPFLRNVTECNHYFGYDDKCSVCDTIFPDIGAGIAAFGGVIVTILISLLFFAQVLILQKKKSKSEEDDDLVFDE